MARNDKQAAQPLALNDDRSVPGYDTADCPMEAGAPQGTPPSRRVLLIEDHPAALALLAMWLGEHGFNVQEFENLSQAMESLDGRPRRSMH